MSHNYYVTADGVAAVLTNPENLSVIRGALDRQRDKVRACRRQGWIAPERRHHATLRGDYTSLLLTGALEKVTAVQDSGQTVRSLVRYAATGRKPGALGPALAKVYRMVASHKDGLSTPDLLKALPSMEPNTIRWAVQVLRQTGHVKTLDSSVSKSHAAERTRPQVSRKKRPSGVAHRVARRRTRTSTH